MSFPTPKPAPTFVWLALAGLLASPACKRPSPPPFAVDRITLSEASLAAHPALGMGPGQVRGAIAAALGRRNVVVLGDGEPAPAGQKPFHLHAEVALARDDDGDELSDGGSSRWIEVGVALEIVRYADDGSQKIAGTGIGRVPSPALGEPDSLGAAYAAAFHQAVQQAAASLVCNAQARAKPTSALVADLGSPDEMIREAAADALVDRHDSRATSQLLRELDSPEDAVRMKAVGQLVGLKARSAVPKLIDLTQAPNPREPVEPRMLVQIIYALGSIGGDEAEAFLYTMESGHPDEAVRQAAREAGEELRAHKPGTRPKEVDATQATAGRLQ